jgi:hypothetical protein
MWAAPNQLVEFAWRDSQVLGDPVEIGAVHLPEFVELAAVLEPIDERADQELRRRKRFALRSHGNLRFTANHRRNSKVFDHQVR